jgi:hypothetical protein
MERAYPYRGYSISIRVEPQLEHATLSDPLGELGFVSVVQILNDGDHGSGSLNGGAYNAFPRLLLTEANGHGFRTSDAALTNGLSAGRRLVDDLLHAAS